MGRNLSENIFNTTRLLNEHLSLTHSNAVFTTSFSIEDQVVTDLLVRNEINCSFVTIDTGRLPEATYKIFDETEKFFDIKITSLYPDQEKLSEITNRYGVNLFYDSVENRKLCCETRKIIPLKKHLKNFDIWITGIRSGQSITRNEIDQLEDDIFFGIKKLNPLTDWNLDAVWNYIRQNNIPYSTLYKQGYTSIGCEPCTRKPTNVDDIRSGRWWWENPQTKECGLHFKEIKN